MDKRNNRGRDVGGIKGIRSCVGDGGIVVAWHWASDTVRAYSDLEFLAFLWRGGY